MKIHARPLAAVAALAASLVAVPSASATIEIKASSPYVAWPGSVTIKARTTIPGVAIELRQERPDKRSVAPGGNGPGWSCVSPYDWVSTSRVIPGEQVVARIPNPPANEWVSVKIPAARLAFTREIPPRELLYWLTPQDRGGICLDPPTTFNRLQARQAYEQQPVPGIRLQRVL